MLGLLWPSGQNVEAIPEALDWEMSGRWFHNSRPAANDALPGTSRLPDRAFFRSWSPQTRSTRARIASSPFLLPPFLVIPFVGYPARPDTALYLECMAGGERLVVASGNAHEDWSMRVIKTDPRWCAGRVRLVASNSSEDSYIGVGPPLRADFALWVRQSVVAVVALQALGFSLFAGTVYGVAQRARRRAAVRSMALEVAVAAVCLCAYEG